MSAWVYSVPGLAEWRRKAFLEWKSIDLSLTCGLMLTIIKVFIILFLFVGIENILAIFKINKEVHLSIECPGIFSSWPNGIGEEDLFWRVQEGVPHCDYPQKHLVVIINEKVSHFVKFKIILPFLCFSLYSLTNKHCRTWSSMINFWIDSRASQK